jgi:hypothetical protein
MTLKANQSTLNYVALMTAFGNLISNDRQEALQTTFGMFCGEG